MKVKTADLTGPALDWAVALAEKLNPRFLKEEEAYNADVLTNTLKRGDYVVVLRPNNRLTPLGQYDGYNDGVCWKNVFSPSTDYNQGGPIIEQEGIEITLCNDLYFPKGNEKGDYYEPYWQAVIDLREGDVMVERQYGPTPLIAAMRCYVASKIGNEVDIPEELLK